MVYKVSGKKKVDKDAGALSQMAGQSLLMYIQNESPQYVHMEEGRREMLIRPNGSSVRRRGALCGPEDVRKIC